MSVVLRHPHVFPCGLVGRHADRDEVGEVSTADNHRACVNSGLAYAAFQLQCIIQHLLDLRSTVFQLVLKLRNEFVAILQVRLVGYLFLVFLESLLDLYFLALVVRVVNLHFFFDELLALLQHVVFPERLFCVLHLGNRLVGNHLSQPVGLIYGKPAHACHILDGTFCRHRPECNHMRDMVFSICFLHIFECPVTAVIIKVDIDIGHVDTVRVEETLEQELVSDRVEIGYLEAVGNG